MYTIYNVCVLFYASFNYSNKEIFAEFFHQIEKKNNEKNTENHSIVSCV